VTDHRPLWRTVIVAKFAKSLTTISGTVYTDEGVSALDCSGTSRTIALSINGASSSTVECSGSGTYTFSNTAAGDGDVLTLFIDGESEKAATVTKVVGTGDMTNINLFQNHIIASDSLSIADIAAGYNQGDDPDVPFTATDSTTDTFVASSGFEVYIPSGYTFTPGGNIDIQDLKIAGTYTATGTEIASISGNFANNGSFIESSSTFVFTGTNTASISGLTGTTFYNFKSTAAGKKIKFEAGTNFQISNNFNINGQDGNNIKIESTASASQWLATFSSEQSEGNVTYTTITDSGCSASQNVILDSTNTSGGNIGSCWSFPANFTQQHFRWRNDDGGETEWYNDNWDYRRKFTIDYNKVGSASDTFQSNFPVLVSVSNSNFKHTNFGGNVASASAGVTGGGGDFVFTSSDGITKLSHEIEKYSSSSGDVIAWVKLASISATETDFYMYYGGPSSGVTNQDKTNVWDSNYAAVYHMHNPSSAASISDSTSYGNYGNPNATIASSSGRIDGSRFFDGVDDRIIVKDSTSLDDLSNAFTIEAWVYDSDAADATGNDDKHPISKGNTGTTAQNTFRWRLLYESGAKKHAITIGDGTSTQEVIATGGTFAQNTWTYLVAAYDGTNIYLYRNGASDVTPTARTITAPLFNSGDMPIGGQSAADCADPFLGCWHGKLDEIKLSKVKRSNDWIKTNYNNQSSPSTFYNMANQVASSSVGTGATFAAPEDTKLTDLAKETNVRLRLLVSNEGIGTASAAFRLEASEANPSSCSAGSYTRIDSHTDWTMSLSSYFADAASTSNIASGSSGVDALTDTASAFQDGQLKESNDTTAGIQLTGTSGTDEFTELEYSLQATTSATDSASYCFRVTNAGVTNDPTFTYSIYASVSIRTPTPANFTQQHFRWRNDDGGETDSNEFGTSGSITSTTGKEIHVLKVDDDYVYLGGYNDSSDWRIEKRNKQTGDICSSTANCADGAWGDSDTGIITVTAGQYAYALDVDDDYLYVGGVKFGTYWYILKYNKQTGDICNSTVNCADGAWGDGDGGTITVTSGASVEAVKVDDDYMYVSGYDSNNNWRIEKYDKQTGDICTSSACADGDFNTDGIITVTTASRSYALGIDDDYMYIGGHQDDGAGGTDWYIQKYDKQTGSICTSSACADGDWGDGNTGIITSTGGDTLYILDVDDDYLYLGGYNDSNQWRIEKYNKQTGDICTSTNCADGAWGDGDTGIITVTAGFRIYDLKTDDDYLYVTGYLSGGDWLIHKYNKQTGDICTSTNCADGAWGDSDTGIITSTAASISYALDVDDNYLYVGGYKGFSDWHVQKYNKQTGDICDSSANCALDNTFSTDGIITVTKASVAYDLVVDDDYVYAVGVSRSQGFDQWYIEKYNKQTGNICSSTANCADGAFSTDGIIGYDSYEGLYAITVDDDYMYVAGGVSGPDYYIRKYNKQTGNLCSSVGNCADGAWGDTDTGIITVTAGEIAYALAVDDDYMYVTGYNNSTNWYTLKYNKQTGDICTSTNCADGAWGDTDTGIITVTAGEIAYALAVDDDYMYVAGNDDAGNDWRIEKYDKQTGDICTSTNCADGAWGDGDTGIITVNPTTDTVYALEIDDDYMYVAGGDSSSNWRIHKYNKQTGDICSSTNCADGAWGDSDTGIITVTTASIAYALAVDDDYMYVGGHKDDGAGGSNWYIEKYNKQTGDICTSSNCADGAWGDGDTGIITVTAGNIIRALKVDDDYMYVGGYNDSNEWRIEKYNKQTGDICDSIIDCGPPSQGATFAAPEDTKLTNLAKETNVRLRLLVSNEGDATASSAFRLEASEANPSSCSAGSYTRIDSHTDWTMSLSSYFADAASTSNIASGSSGVDALTDTASAFQDGQLKESNDTTAGIQLTGTSGTDEFTELEYSLQATTSATGGASYCFRVTNAGVTNDPAFTYSKYASASIVAASTIDLGGIIYTGEGVSALDCTSSRTVAVSINGAAPSTVECSGSGVYSFSSLSANSGAVLTLFLNDESEKAVTVTKSTGSNMSTIDLYQNHIIASGSLSIANMAAGYNQGNDSDVPFTATNAVTDTLVASSGWELFIPSGYTFTPGGNLNIDDLKIAGTYTATGTEIATLSGNFTNNGTFNAANSTFVFASASKGNESISTSTISGSASGTEVVSFYNFTVTEPNKIIEFKAGSSTSFTNNLTLKGTRGNPVHVKSTTPNTQWLLNLSGSATVDYLKIKDSGCYTGTNSVTMSFHDIDAGFNDSTCWLILNRAGGAGSPTDGGSGGGTPQSGGGESGGGESGTDGGSGGGGGQSGGGEGGGSGGASPIFWWPILWIFR